MRDHERGRRRGGRRLSGAWRTAALATPLLFAPACATIVSGTSERIRFESRPEGAQVRVDGQTYTCPAEVTLARSSNHDVEYMLPDHISATRQVLQDNNGWLWGNLLFGGVIGIMIDYSTGASNDLEPDVMVVELVPVPHPPAAADAQAAGVVPAAAPPGPPAATPVAPRP